MNQLRNLVVYGQKETSLADNSVVYVLESSNRGADNKHVIALDDKDKQMEFVFADGTTWFCDAATLHELYPEADPAIRPPGQRSGDNDSFELPPTIQSPAAERGIIGSIAVKMLKVFAPKAIGTGVADLAKKLENKHLIHGIPENNPVWAGGFQEKFIKDGAAIFRIDEKFGFNDFSARPSNDPFFLFIHGTNSDTLGAFADLSKSAAWANMHSRYKDNVIAFQHRTMTESPLENAVKLAILLPENANLHIISHSRGGIVGDLMCMYSTIKGVAPIGFTNENIELLKKEGNREKDIEHIKTLNKIFKTKKISVTKFIRVACPAAGTKLASKRLDHILNVFFNLFGGSANPYADVFKELLSAVISTKDNVNVLPGIEAQSPGSPFIKVLNDQSDKTAIDGSSLAVISGNGTLSFSGNGLMVILGKLFYWQRNDLVVNTDSMYMGAKRKNNIRYFFAQGVDVNHVKYFANNNTREVINLALNTPEGEVIPGFKSIPQNAIPASDRDDRGLEHGELFPTPGLPSGNKPIVVLLPGIMGSNLSHSGGRLWLNYISAIFGGLLKLEHPEDTSIIASSVVKTSYNKLASWLSAKYDVVIYPFDWRRQLNDCAKEFDNKIKTLLQFDQPIKIIGHSMGGVLVRDFIINHDDTWQKLNKSKGFRLLFLGSPLGGSFRIPTVLFGQDAIINSLNMLDRVHTKKELLEMFSGFPGILSLLPLTTDAENDFAAPATWQKMKTVQGDATWPIPSKDDLAVFKKYRDNILAKKDGIDYSNMVYIAGKDKQTPCGYFNDVIPPRTELAFLYTSEGDQSVTWQLGIPKQMEDAGNVYFVPVTHGALANEPDIFEGIDDILSVGATTLLKKTRPLTRGEEKIFRAPAPTNFDLSERGLENAVFGIEDKKQPLGSRVPLSVTVSNGDLSYASFPLLAGHFINDGILYAEKIIDNSLNNMLSAKHHLGLYPGDIGTNEIFMDCNSSFAGAVITGLGDPGNLTAHELSRTVEQGISNYLLSIKNLPADKHGTGISSLIIGCGYGGLSVESSLKAIIEGVNNANEKATSFFKNECKTIQHIEFVEVYAYRALSCMYALNKIAGFENASYNIVIGSKKIKNLLGIRKRIPLDTSEDWWNRITVKYKPAKKGSGQPSSMVFGASTGDSREEENELFSNIALINLFIEEISTRNQWTADAAKTLFALMVPNELKEKIKRKGNISWILDSNTASYPWELLQDNTVNAKPLCINSGMIRQLSVSDYQIKIKRVAAKKALVIADPVLGGFISQLPGAREEGRIAEEAMKNAGYPVTSVINKNAADIVRSFFSDDYSIIHLAGHGVFNPDAPEKSGMVIGNDVFLTVFNIKQMPVVPELVFVNCCHLGKITAGDEKFYQERYKLAANIGTELIKIGVKAVIAAGWAVNDTAALDFARQFYVAMFAGDNFGDAVKKARTFIYEKHPGNNTWGAYQCYGDPFFKLKNTTGIKKAWAPAYIVPEEAEIDLDNLVNQLQMGKKTTEDNLADLKTIISAIEKADFTSAASPQITEKQALIYLEMAMYKESVAKFEELLTMENAGFSFFCMEKYCNTRAKLYIKDIFDRAADKTDAVLKSAARKMDKVINDLTVLYAAGKTAERLNLLGSTYKRKAMVLADKTQRAAAYKAAAAAYREAALISGNNNEIYSLTNAIELEIILHLYGAVALGTTYTVSGKTYKVYSKTDAVKRLNELKENIVIANTVNNQNYWDMVAVINIDLCLLFLDEKTDDGVAGWDDIGTSFNKIWKKAGSESKRAAELEHVQFLTHALSALKTHTAAAAKKAASDDKKGIAGLAGLITQLRAAWHAATSKNNAKKKTAAPAKKTARKKAKK
ncbi:MAG: CHAT domain-containing protein [Chitinophagaceae bacterium]